MRKEKEINGHPVLTQHFSHSFTSTLDPKHPLYNFYHLVLHSLQLHSNKRRRKKGKSINVEMENKFSSFLTFFRLYSFFLFFYFFSSSIYTENSHTPREFLRFFNFMLHFAHNKVKLKIMEIKINVMDTFFCSHTHTLFHSLFSSSSSGDVLLSIVSIV